MTPGTGSGRNPKVRHSGAGLVGRPAPLRLYRIDERAIIIEARSGRITTILGVKSEIGGSRLSCGRGVSEAIP